MTDNTTDHKQTPSKRAMIENRIKAKWPELESTAVLNVSDLKRLVHDLKNHQIELQLQNEELRNAQLEIQEARENYYHLFHDMPSGCVLLDSQGIILDANPRFLEITGHEKGDIQNNRFEAVIAEKERDRFHIHRMTVLDSAARGTVVINALTKDGDEREVLLESAPMHMGKDRRNVLINLVTEVERVDKREVDKREVDKREHERESLSKQRQALFRESNHRIKNNLAVIDSLINLSSSHLEDPIALGIFNDIRVRIQSMARAHGLLDLCDDREKVDIKGFLEGLVDQNISSVAMIGRNIQVHKHFPEAGHSVNTAMAVGFILSEMLCNCAKHAFTDRSEGAVNVLVRKIGRDRYELVVKDDGGGFPKDFKDKKDSIGMELMETMAEYVEGTLVFTNDKGATAILRYRDTP